MTKNTFSPELKLVLACCRWPPAPDVVRETAAAVTDWGQFRDLLGRHGVVALAGNALSQAGVVLPCKDRNSLQTAIDTQVRKALHITRVTSQLAQLISNANIACRFIKGPTLARLAFNDFGLKRSADIDVLVSLTDALMVRDLLLSAGFMHTHSYEMDATTFTRYLRWGKEIPFTNHEGTIVELHVRLAQNQYMMRDLHSEGDSQDVLIGTVAVPTFSDELIYPYLCYHGAVHGWSRLKWLADLNGFLEGRDVARLHSCAVTQGVADASIVALSLCRDLLGREKVVSKRFTVVGRLQRSVAVAAIGNSTGGSEINSFSRIGLALIISGATIGGRWSGAVGGLAAVWNQPHTRASYGDKSAWIFHLLRGPRFLLSLPTKLRRGAPMVDGAPPRI